MLAYYTTTHPPKEFFFCFMVACKIVYCSLFAFERKYMYNNVNVHSIKQVCFVLLVQAVFINENCFI